MPEGLDTADRRLAVRGVPGADWITINLAGADARTRWSMQLYDGGSVAPIFDPIFARLFSGRGRMFVTVSALDVGGADPNATAFARWYFVLERSASRRWTVQYGR